MLKIAISGKAGSGKNTAANIIAQNVLKLPNEKYKISAFANKIKETISLWFPECDPKNIYGASELRQKQIRSNLDKFVKIQTTFRQASVDIGKLGRSYDPAFWVAHVAYEYICLPPGLSLYCLSDLRFPEEYQWVKDNGFILCRIKKTKNTDVNDISETIQDQLKDEMFDIVIDNDGTIEELQAKLTEEVLKFS